MAPPLRRRPAVDLPGNPGKLTLEYRHDCRVEGLMAEYDCWYDWTVSVRELRRRHQWTCRYDQPGPEIGSFTFIRLCDDGHGGALSAAEGDDLELYNMVLPLVPWGGDVREAFDGLVEQPTRDLLVLFRARLDPAWRGPVWARPPGGRDPHAGTRLRGSRRRPSAPSYAWPFSSVGHRRAGLSGKDVDVPTGE